jgi:hypothetical protein
MAQRIAITLNACHRQLTSRQDRADVVIPHIEQRSHRTKRRISITAPVWCIMLTFTTAAIAGETTAPKRHSLIHRPVNPASPAVGHPETSVPPSQPIVAATPPVTAPSSPSLHHKLMKKPLSPSAGNLSTPEATVTPTTSSRLSPAGYLAAASPATVADGASKSAPAPVIDRPIVPIATPPLLMSALGSAAPATSARSLAAAAQSTAAANSRLAPAGLSPSMARLIQLSPGFTALLQPSSPVVASPSGAPRRPPHPHRLLQSPQREA